MRSPSLVSLCLCLAGCSFLVTPSLSSVERGREIYPKCQSSPEEMIAPLFLRDGIDSFAPAYTYLPGGPNGGEHRPKGVRIVARPAPGWSPESLTRSLECHEARIALGHVAARTNEPFALRSHWVSVDVESDGNAFAIVLHTTDFDDAKELAARARLFYGDPPGAS